MYWQLSFMTHECDVLGDTVVMLWIVEELAGAACGVDCS